MLVEEADEDGELLLPVEAAARFSPPLSTIKAETSLDHLYVLGFVDWRLENGSQAYFATREGARIVENSFNHIESGGTTSWVPKDGIVLDADKLVALETEAKIESASGVVAKPPTAWTINNNIYQANSPKPDAINGRSATMGTWIGVALAVAAILVSLWIGDKI